jgi:hypothetical protein
MTELTFADPDQLRVRNRVQNLAVVRNPAPILIQQQQHVPAAPAKNNTRRKEAKNAYKTKRKLKKNK